MDEQKYTIRKLASLPGASVRILLQKASNRSFLVPFLIVLGALVAGSLYVWLGLDDEETEKAVRAIVTGLMWGGVYSLGALGIVVVYKSTRIFNMGHGGILLFLTYLAWYLLADDQQGWPVWLGLITLAAAAVGFGLVIDRLLFRGMIGRQELETFIMTLVFGFSFLQGVTILVFEGKSQIMPEFIPPWVESGKIHVIGNYNLNWELLFSFCVALLMFLVFVAYFRFTKSGLAMRCVSESNVISQSLGIKVKQIYAIAWVVACLAAAIGGILVATHTAVYSESGGMGTYALMRALPIVLLGGLESIPGAFLAALMIGLAEQLSAAYIDPYVKTFRAVLPFILMLMVMVVKPQGLFGLKGIKRI